MVGGGIRYSFPIVEIVGAQGTRTPSRCGSRPLNGTVYPT